eukprot:superscaffoldBa00004473_g18937
MAEEEETREVLFPDWEGPDKTGLTIEQTREGEIFVKEVKGESPAARSGKVYEGDQIVGATIYFDNMSSEETAELLKTLNRHKVGLKLQNKGDKSPCCSPLSTPCRSPMGTLTWEGKTRFGGSSPDIILSGDDEDYKRIYTKKIKPRLKSEDLAEGVDVRTERHSSTSSDGSTITTITRRITTYTVDMPSGISEQLELSSPEFKGLRHESGDGCPRIRISHGSPSGKVGTEEGVFESSNVSYTGPQLSSTETHLGTGGVQTTTITREIERERGTGLRFKGPNFGITGGKGQGGIEISRGSGEHGDGSMTIRDSTNTGSRHVTKGELGGAEAISTDENGGSVSLSLPGKSMQIMTTSMDKTQEGSVDTSLGERTKVKVSGITISHPQAKESGSIHIPNVTHDGGSMDIDTELRGSRIGGSVPTLGYDTSGYSSGPGKVSMAGVDVNLTGSKLKSEVDVNLPSSKGGIKASGIDTETEDTVKMSKIKMPAFGMKGIKKEGTSVEVKLSGETDMSVPVTHEEVRKPEIEIKGTHMLIKGPSANIEGPAIKAPKVDIKMPEAVVESTDVKIKGPKFNLPSISGSKMSDLEIGKVKGDMDVSVPQIKGEIKGPEVDANMSAPKIQGEIKAPRVDIEGPDVDIECPSGNIKGSKFKVPSKISMPGVDLGVKGPKLKGDMDISGPKIEGDIKTPDVDIKGPKINIEGPKGGFEMPKIKMPSFGLKGQKMEGPDIDVNLPKANIDVKAPAVDMEVPEVDVKEPNVKLKGPKFNMPTVSGPEISMPGVDINLKGPKLKGDMDVSASNIKTPDVDIKGPEVNIEGPKGGFEMPKIKMPSFNIKGPKAEGSDLDLNLPKTGADIKTPKVDIKAPEIDIEGSDAKIKGPKLKMPSITGPKMPDFDIKLKGPKVEGDVNVSVPKVEGDIKAPEVDFEGPDVDIEGNKGGFKMPKFKIPSFGLKGPKVEGPEVDVNLPKAKIDVKAPEVDVKVPEVDIEGPDAKLKGPKFNMPTISGPKLSMPDVDFNLKGPKLKGDVDVSAPRIEGDIKTPDFDIKGPKVEIEGPKGPEVDIEGPNAKLKGPKFNMPTISGPKLSMPDVDFNLKGPKLKGDVDVSAPKIEGDIKTPEVDIKGPNVDLKSPGGHFVGPKMKLPKISGPKISLPDVDINLKGPKVKGDMEGDIQLPKVELEGPNVTADVPDIGTKKSKFKMPKFGFKGPKAKAPETDVKLGQGDISIKGKTGSSEGLDVDVSMTGPKAKGSKFKMPKFGFKGPKVEMPDTDINLPKAGAEMKIPDVDMEGPDVDIDSPSGKIKGPKFKMPHISGPKISMPDVDFNLKGPKLKGDVDVSVPKVEGDLTAPEVDIKGPQVDIEGPKGGFEMPKIKMPSFGIKSPNMEGPDVAIDLPKADMKVKPSEIDIKAPDVDVEGPDAKLKGPKLKLPSISAPKMPEWDINLKGPKLKGDVNVTGPKIEGDIEAPKVDIEAPDIDIASPSGKIKGPKMKMPTISGPKISLPDVDFNLKGPKLKGDVDVSRPKIGGDITAPEFDIKGPEMDIEGPDAKIKGPKFKVPNITGPKLS